MNIRLVGSATRDNDEMPHKIFFAMKSLYNLLETQWLCHKFLYPLVQQFKYRRNSSSASAQKQRDVNLLCPNRNL